MIDAVITSYDEVPYESRPYLPSHPDCLAVAGRLRGLDPASPRRCRVLELGCATGGNLIPMAYQYPESEFVGVDLSATQIAAGRRLCQQLGMNNIDLRAASILDLDETAGQFDYILCHGVFSWVPRPVQDHILWICRHLLKPHGVAFVSYNTYPGWHQRAVTRELMRFYTARFDQPQVKIEQARAVLSFMVQAAAQCKSPLAALLEEEAKDLEGDPGHYLFHEHLEDENSPLYFSEFMARAEQHGLQYLSEAWFHLRLASFPPEVFRGLAAMSRNLVELEQFADFLENRKFRRTLLCHAQVSVARQPAAESMYGFHFSALADPVSATPDVVSEAPEKFKLGNGVVATTNCPILKAALVVLFERWPATMPFDELFAQAADRSRTAAEAFAESRSRLAAMLLDGYLGHLVNVHTHQACFTTHVHQRPRASALARAIAAGSAQVPNLRHMLANLDPVDQKILQLANGTRTLADIAHVVEQTLAAQGNAAPRQVVEQSFRRLAEAAVLEA